MTSRGHRNFFALRTWVTCDTTAAGYGRLAAHIKGKASDETRFIHLTGRRRIAQGPMTAQTVFHGNCRGSALWWPRREGHAPAGPASREGRLHQFRRALLVPTSASPDGFRARSRPSQNRSVQRLRRAWQKTSLRRIGGCRGSPNHLGTRPPERQGRKGSTSNRFLPPVRGTAVTAMPSPGATPPPGVIQSGGLSSWGSKTRNNRTRPSRSRSITRAESRRRRLLDDVCTG